MSSNSFFRYYLVITARNHHGGLRNVPPPKKKEVIPSCWQIRAWLLFSRSCETIRPWKVNSSAFWEEERVPLGGDTRFDGSIATRECNTGVCTRGQKNWLMFLQHHKKIFQSDKSFSSGGNDSVTAGVFLIIYFVVLFPSSFVSRSLLN